MYQSKPKPSSNNKYQNIMARKTKSGFIILQIFPKAKKKNSYNKTYQKFKHL